MRRPSVASVAAGSEAETCRAGGGGRRFWKINGQAAGSDFDRRLAELRPGDTVHLRVRSNSGKPTKRELHWKLGTRQRNLSLN